LTATPVATMATGDINGATIAGIANRADRA
jgi:hypothetical protein